jgi:hypothetical protein
VEWLQCEDLPPEYCSNCKKELEECKCREPLEVKDAGSGEPDVLPEW